MISEEAALSKYQLVAEQIRQKIENGDYHYGKKMPTISELSEIFQVSHMTVKKAIDQLETAGYIDRRKGSGIFVKMNPGWVKRKIPLSGNSSRFPAGTLHSRIMKFEVVHPSPEVAEHLQIDESAFVYDIERVRLYEDKPIIIEYCYMPIDVVPGITEEVLRRSIYQHIRETLKRKISSSVFTITGVRPTEEDMRCMNLQSTDFLMQIVQTVYFDDGTVFEYSIDKHIPEQFRYSDIEINMS